MVSGSLRATDTLYSTAAQFQILRIPTESNGTTYGPGTSGQILKSNGTSVYWASDNNSDTQVTQAAAITTAGAYPIILANSTATSAVTGTVNKTSTLTYNPNTKALVTGGTVDGYVLAAASAKAVTDSSSASAISTGTSLPTERDIYYGLPTINNAHNYTSSTSIYAPTSGGTANQLLVSTGSTSAPTWRTLVATDIPDISDTYLKLTGGTLTGRVTTTKPVNQILIGTHTNAVTTSPYKPVLWTFNTGNTVQDGDNIIIKMPGAGHDYGVFVSIDNGTSYHPIVRFNGNRLTTHYPSGTYLHLVYSASAVTNSVFPAAGATARSNITGSWQIINDYDSGNSTDRLYSAAGASRTAETSANGGIGLFRYSLQLMTANQTWSSIACVNGSTDASQGTTTSKISATADFLLNSPILYSDTNVRVAPGSSSNVNGYTAMPIDIRYNTSGTVSLTIQKPVYLVGKANSDGATFKLLTTNWWTQTLPTTNDGNIYIFLGLAYATTSIYLTPYHPIYYHNGTTVMPYTPGIVGVANGGTGATSIANIQAGKDGDGNTISSTYAKLAAGNRFTAISNRFRKIILEEQAGAYLSFGILNNTQGFPDYDDFIQIQPSLSSIDASLTFSISNTNSDKTQWKTERFSLPSVEIGTNGGNYDILTTKNTITVAQGGTNIASYTIGDILYASGSTALSKLNGNTTTTRKFLTSVATTSGTAVAPQWDTVTKTDVGLSDVENTKLSTWTGSTNITTLGTINSGTWQGTTIAASYIGNHSTDKLTSGTLPIARGGTGATSAADARANLTAVKYIKLTSTNTDTWAHLWTELNEITAGEVANFTTTATSATQKITGGKVTQNLLHGTIVRTSTNELEFRIGAAMPATGSYLFFTLTFSSNHSSCTVGTVYRAQGTAM